MKIEIGPAVVSEFVRITKGPPDKFLGSSLQESWSFLTIEGRTLQLRGPKLLLGEKELCSVRPGDSVAFRAEGVFHNDERLTDLSRSGE